MECCMAFIKGKVQWGRLSQEPGQRVPRKKNLHFC